MCWHGFSQKVESETKCGGGGLAAKLCPTPDCSCQSPLSMGFPTGKDTGGLDIPSPGSSLIKD